MSAYEYIVAFVSFLVVFFFLKRFISYTLLGIITFHLVAYNIVAVLTVSYFGLILTSLVFIYNKMFALSQAISKLGGGCIGSVLCCAGLDSVISNFFNEFFALILSAIVLYSLKNFVNFINMVLDKVWRLGVLLGLAK